ncbi:hypothetical protein DIPPA_16495 [Diplonema papillatum]|nr:hypothetical protein DIPPA_16495 [Diplonema papillatum]
MGKPAAKARSRASGKASALSVTVLNPRWNGDHAVYDLRLKDAATGIEVTSVRRYTEFSVVINHLKKATQAAQIPPTPPKKWVGNSKESLLEKRAQMFQGCLTAMLANSRLRRSRSLCSLVGCQILRERQRTLNIMLASARRAIFLKWRELAGHRSRAAGSAGEFKLDDYRHLASEVARVVGENEASPARLAVLLQNKVGDLERCATGQGVPEGDARSASLEQGIVDLSRTVCGPKAACRTGELALRALAEHFEAAAAGEKHLEALRAEVSTLRAQELKHEMLTNELAALATRVKGTAVRADDAVLVIENEVKRKDASIEHLVEENRLRDESRRLQEEGNVMTRDRAMSLQQQLSATERKVHVLEKMYNNFTIEKATIVDSEEKDDTTFFNIDVVSTEGQRWRCAKRYKMFARLKKRLGPAAKGVPIPAKVIGRLNEKKLRERTDQLNTFLAHLMSRARTDQAVQVELTQFLSAANQADALDVDDDDDFDVVSQLSSSVRPNDQSP